MNLFIQLMKNLIIIEKENDQSIKANGQLENEMGMLNSLILCKWARALMFNVQRSIFHHMYSQIFV